MASSDSVKMTYSSIVPINGRPGVSVTFERGSDMAEGIIPSGKIRSSQGFSEEELQQLSDYLITNEKKILEDARKLSSLEHLLS